MATSTFSYVGLWQRKLDSIGWWHSFDLPDGRHFEGVSTIADQQERIGKYPIPKDLRGARVLDIGAWDGWYGFEMERRGADVMAVDTWDNPRFRQIHSLLKSKIDYRQMDVYELTPETVGRFDIVLFMGVLYHLKHPLLALERVCALTKELAVVDSFILREKHRPGENIEERAIMEFYETDEFGGQRDNWCGPTLRCLMAMCRTAGFARVEHKGTLANGACIACFRKWEAPTKPKAAAPELIDAYHHTNFGINFYTKHDEYLTVFFRWPDGKASVDRVRPQVGEYGVRPIFVDQAEGGSWQANFKLPPGLTPGWHDVIVRGEGAISSAKPIAVDMPVPESSIHITGACDGATWEPGRLDLRKGSVLSAWIAGLPENADRNNVRVLLGGERLPILFLSPAGIPGERQVNLQVPADVPRGGMELEIQVGPSRTNPFPIQISE